MRGFSKLCPTVRFLKVFPLVERKMFKPQIRRPQRVKPPRFFPKCPFISLLASEILVPPSKGIYLANRPDCPIKEPFSPWMKLRMKTCSNYTRKSKGESYAFAFKLSRFLPGGLEVRFLTMPVTPPNAYWVRENVKWHNDCFRFRKSASFLTV